MRTDEPYCPHAPKVRVSSHEDLAAASKTDDPIASIYACDRERCVERAQFWVQGTTGRPAVVIELPSRKKVTT